MASMDWLGLCGIISANMAICVEKSDLNWDNLFAFIFAETLVNSGFMCNLMHERAAIPTDFTTETLSKSVAKC